MAELLTQEIAYAYRDRAVAIPDNGMQDIGERRALREELQVRCGVTELEAINIINGFHIDMYCRKYLLKMREEETNRKYKQQYTRTKHYSIGKEEGKTWRKQKVL